jgi:tetratricopeptide (TPR) repeat protein
MTAEALAHIGEPVPSVTAFRRELPRSLDDVFRRALSKTPDERYGTALELVWALRDALAESAGDTATLPVARAEPKRRRRLSRLLAAVALAAAAVAGLAAGLLLSAGSSRVRTLTVGGRTIQQTIHQTVHQTVTAPSPAPPPAASPPAAPPSPSGDPHGLNDHGYSLMKQGDWAAALPYLQAAVRGLSGTGPADPYEAYANYNLGYTLTKLGRCSEALPYLERADRLEPGNGDVHAALAHARSC